MKVGHNTTPSGGERVSRSDGGVGEWAEVCFASPVWGWALSGGAARGRWAGAPVGDVANDKVSYEMILGYVYVLI